MLCINWACEIIKILFPQLLCTPWLPRKFRFGTRYLILPKFGLDVSSMYRASKSAYENA